MHPALEQMLARLVLDPAVPLDEPGRMRDWLQAHGVEAADRDFLVEQGFDRLGVYRTLARDTLLGALATALPCTAGRLGPVLGEYGARFIAEHPPSRRQLRDVALEFVAFALPLWATDDRVPGYVPDLARHEAVQMELAALPQPVTEGLEPRDALQPSSRLRFAAATRLMHYDYAVHTLPDDPAAREPPAARPTWLFAYRDEFFCVRFLELSPLAAGIIGRLLGNEPLSEAVLGACAAAGRDPAADVLDGTAAVLSDLAERGAVIGIETETGGRQDEVPSPPG